MAEYKGIHGTKVQNYTSDPANPITGQVWYNETSQTMKFQAVTTSGTWATSADMNTANFGMGGNGTINTALSSGGANTPTALTSKCETFNGTAWTAQSDMNTRKYFGSNAGDSTAGLAFAGEPADPGRAGSEEFNGSTWTTTADLNTGREAIQGTGTQTAGIATGGAPLLTITELYNGSTWTEVNDLNTGGNSCTMAGADSTAAILIGRNVSPNAQTESWNGTCWAEVNDLNTGRNGARGSGTATLALAASSGTPATANLTENWNGTCWSTDTNLNTARDSGGAAGTNNTESIFFGGRVEPTLYASTEEFTGAGASVTRTITSS
jgi:hypothetical protein